MASGDLHDFRAPRSPATPWQEIFPQRLVSVEHPYIVKDLSKGVESLGGQKELSKTLSHDGGSKALQLSFRGNGQMSSSVSSCVMQTDNLLLRIEIPKRTGRKRKHGSSLWQTDRDSVDKHLAKPLAAPLKQILRTLQDHLEARQLFAIGHVEQTHRFRDMPDFVFSTSKNKLLNRVRETLMKDDYEAVKRFRFDKDKAENDHTEMIPPPAFSQMTIPFNYSYRQNPSMKQTVDTAGTIHTFNESSNRKIRTIRAPFDIKNVPTGPTEDTPRLESLDDRLRSLVSQIKACMEFRPIWSRRALMNQIRSSDWSADRHIYPYIGYMFKSGPWRDAVVKYGIDPRKDPKYRVYQTMSFQVEPDAAKKVIDTTRKLRGGNRQRTSKRVNDGGLGVQSHVFDGVTVGLDGKVWQVCDITDPLIRSILATEELRETCHAQLDGWYHNGTWAKAKIITRAKIWSLVSTGTAISDTAFTKILTLPASLSVKNWHQATLGKGSPCTPQEIEWATAIRNHANLGVPGGIAPVRQGQQKPSGQENIETRLSQALIPKDGGMMYATDAQAPDEYTDSERISRRNGQHDLGLDPNEIVPVGWADEVDEIEDNGEDDSSDTD